MFLASWEETVAQLGLYFTGLLPFARLDNFDVLSAPFMTRDFIARKVALKRQMSTFSADYWALTGYVYMIPWLNRLTTGYTAHLERRGVLNVFWVVNCDDEVALAANVSGVRGIMTDRPAAVAKYLEKL